MSEAPKDVDVRPLLPRVLLALTVATGILDAVSFLSLGRVFTANMTGNIVLLGFSVVGAPGLSFERSGMALLAFAAGAVLGGRLAHRIGTPPRPRWLAASLLLEAGLLVAACVPCLGAAGDVAASAGIVYPAIVLTALAMGIRNAVVRSLAVKDLTTTVVTLTLTGLAADSPLGGGTTSGLGRRVAAVGAMLSGAAAGAFLTRSSIALALGLAAAIAAGCAGVVFAKRGAS